jgi:hypothetical protein
VQALRIFIVPLQKSYDARSFYLPLLLPLIYFFALMATSLSLIYYAA